MLGGDDHLPALPPHNSATVEGKLPPTGPTVWLTHQQLAYSANEGEPFSIGIVFNAGESVAQPGESIAISLLTEDDGTATINQDYGPYFQNRSRHAERLDPRLRRRVTRIRATRTSTSSTTNLYEPDVETFNAYMKPSEGQSDKLVIPDFATTPTAGSPSQ